MPEVYRRNCAKCRRAYSTEHQGDTLCPKCRSKLPKCGCCGRAMGRRYGLMEDYARVIKGFGDICTSCDYEMRHKGFLHLDLKHSGQRFLLPDGTTSSKMPRRNNDIIMEDCYG